MHLKLKSATKTGKAANELNFLKIRLLMLKYLINLSLTSVLWKIKLFLTATSCLIYLLFSIRVSIFHSVSQKLTPRINDRVVHVYCFLVDSFKKSLIYYSNFICTKQRNILKSILKSSFKTHSTVNIIKGRGSVGDNVNKHASSDYD